MTLGIRMGKRALAFRRGASITYVFGLPAVWSVSCSFYHLTFVPSVSGSFFFSFDSCLVCQLLLRLSVIHYGSCQLLECKLLGPQMFTLGVTSYLGCQLFSLSVLNCFVCELFTLSYFSASFVSYSLSVVGDLLCQ